ncbi:hypothetical protein MAR_020068 [Mya arenaria]|uniref:Uncharacterized protein n=1 Tax=Mya arenaria TaxID=6604 RepID=A0ABY7E8H0_MYAAR|nr:hypothetical protein MAR_020068 [Mya arenaria]
MDLWTEAGTITASINHSVVIRVMTTARHVEIWILQDSQIQELGINCTMNLRHLNRNEISKSHSKCSLAIGDSRLIQTPNTAKAPKYQYDHGGTYQCDMGCKCICTWTLDHSLLTTWTDQDIPGFVRNIIVIGRRCGGLECAVLTWVHDTPMTGLVDTHLLLFTSAR